MCTCELKSGDNLFNTQNKCLENTISPWLCMASHATRHNPVTLLIKQTLHDIETFAVVYLEWRWWRVIEAVSTALVVPALTRRPAFASVWPVTANCIDRQPLRSHPTTRRNRCIHCIHRAREGVARLRFVGHCGKFSTRSGLCQKPGKAVGKVSRMPCHDFRGRGQSWAPLTLHERGMKVDL